MSTLTTATISFLRSISEMREQFEQYQAALSTDLSWSMPEAYRLYVQHPVTCPYCEEEFDNDRSYLVDVTQRRVRAAWRGSTKSYMLYSTHPHVSSAGIICYGTFPYDQPSGPLFTGLNPDSAYTNMKAWLQEQDHDCEAMQDSVEEDDDEDLEICQFCDREFSADSHHWYGWSDALENRVCTNCRDENVGFCAHCEGEFDISSSQDELIYVESTDAYYCEGCLSNNFTECDICCQYHRDNTVCTFTTINGFYKTACQDCLETVSTQECVDCYRVYETEGDPGICPRCTSSEPNQ